MGILFHATHLHALHQIFLDKKIKQHHPLNHIDLLRGVYTLYFSNEIKLKRKEGWNWYSGDTSKNDVILGISLDVLDVYPFYICDKTYYGQCRSSKKIELLRIHGIVPPKKN